jgi:hypothetical protein
MPNARREWLSRLVLVAVAGAALVNGGCLAAAAVGAAGGGAAALYAYQRGRLFRDYPAALTDATAAVRTSLAELQFPPGTEKSDGGSFVFETRATDGTKIHIFLDAQTSRVPAEGPITRVTVRVGAFGDDAVSARILDQVSVHLVVPPAAQSSSAPPPLAAPAPPRPPETVAPPLAAPLAAGK